VNSIANTPAPPCYVGNFTSLHSQVGDGHGAMAERKRAARYLNVSVQGYLFIVGYFLQSSSGQLPQVRAWT
jgi:hypothetical protein